MGYTTERDYRKLAEAVADDFIDQQIPLNDSITKLAERMDLNQEQIARLCEATNNATFTKLFKGKDKTASDRIIEFDIADSKKVLGSQIKEASFSPSPEKLAAYELRPLQDEMHWHRHQEEKEESEFNKIAFELRPETKASEEVDRRTLSKVLETMQSRKLAANMHYQDTMQELRDRFRRIYDVLPFNQFEKQASAFFGVDAIKPLNEIRSLMNKPEANYNLDVLIKTAGLVDDATHEMQLMKKIIKEAATCRQLDLGIAKLESVL